MAEEKAREDVGCQCCQCYHQGDCPISWHFPSVFFSFLFLFISFFPSCSDNPSYLSGERNVDVGVEGVRKEEGKGFPASHIPRFCESHFGSVTSVSLRLRRCRVLILFPFAGPAASSLMPYLFLLLFLLFFVLLLLLWSVAD